MIFDGLVHYLYAIFHFNLLVLFLYFGINAKLNKQITLNKLDELARSYMFIN